jgi:hypothetical protein
MRTLGRLTTLALIAGVAAAVVLGLKSKEDVERYLKIRSM